MLKVNVEMSIGRDAPVEFEFIGLMSDKEKRFAAALFNSYLNKVSRDPCNKFTLSGFLEETRSEFDNMPEAERLGFDSLDAALKEIHDEQKMTRGGLLCPTTTPLGAKM